MNAINPATALNRGLGKPPATERAARPGLQDVDVRALCVAAHVLAYPVATNSIDYGEAVSALARTAIDMGAVSQSTADLDLLLELLERKLNERVLAMSRAAAEDIRTVLVLCKTRKAAAVIVRAAAEVLNDAHGSPLPEDCLAWMIKQSGAAADGT